MRSRGGFSVRRRLTYLWALDVEKTGPADTSRARSVCPTPGLTGGDQGGDPAHLADEQIRFLLPCWSAALRTDNEVTPARSYAGHITSETSTIWTHREPATQRACRLARSRPRLAVPSPGDPFFLTRYGQSVAWGLLPSGGW
jgi:hypothetical protein